MAIKFHGLEKDTVIDGYVIPSVTTYSFALDNFFPLIKRLDIQRDTLNIKFYNRLEKDIILGCVIPPITIAFINSFKGNIEQEELEKHILFNLDSAFVLDGIQRLNTLKRASLDPKFENDRSIQVNFIIAGSRDKLLYRMITLNNGQKPMSARHQIDVLADCFFNFDNVDLNLIPEKGKGRARAPDTFKKADFVKGYVAYLSNSVNIDNQKIIEEKMDELIATKILDSDITDSTIEFTDLVNLINKFSQSSELKEWIRVHNNFIGFCVGAKKSIKTMNDLPLTEIKSAIENFEKAFDSIDVSKVRLGKIRRELVSHYIQNFNKFKDMGEYELIDEFSAII